MKRIKRKLIAIWKKSPVYKEIDKAVSKHFSKKLKNDNFTILCSNCIGGVIYHRLGKRFLSPTINLFMSQPDFVEFCTNLQYYLEKELNFIEAGTGYPVAELTGNGKNIATLRIDFNHENDTEEAKRKWDERKKRINMDNLYIILYKLDGVSVEQLKKLEKVKCNNKVVLTEKAIPEIEWSFLIKPNYRENYPSAYLGKDVFGVRRFEKKFDFVEFLNQRK